MRTAVGINERKNVTTRRFGAAIASQTGSRRRFLNKIGFPGVGDRTVSGSDTEPLSTTMTSNSERWRVCASRLARQLSRPFGWLRWGMMTEIKGFFGSIGLKVEYNTWRIMHIAD